MEVGVVEHLHTFLEAVGAVGILLIDLELQGHFFFLTLDSG